MTNNPQDKEAIASKAATDWLASAERQYDKIVKEMRQISADSKLSGGKNYYLMLHCRSNNGQHFLRWRSYGSQHKHLTWDQMESALNKMSEVLRSYYLEANAHIELLNAQELAARSALKLARKLVKGK